MNLTNHRFQTGNSVTFSKSWLRTGDPHLNKANKIILTVKQTLFRYKMENSNVHSESSLRTGDPRLDKLSRFRSETFLNFFRFCIGSSVPDTGTTKLSGTLFSARRRRDKLITINFVLKTVCSLSYYSYKKTDDKYCKK